MAQSGWPVSLITQTEYANAPTNQYSNEKYANDPTNQYGIEKSLYHDGQVIFSASFDGPTAECDLSTAEKTVHDLAIKFGEMRAFTKVTTEWPMLEFRAEYYRIGAAKDLINSASKDDPLVANVSGVPLRMLTPLLTQNRNGTSFPRLCPTTVFKPTALMVTPACRRWRQA